MAVDTNIYTQRFFKNTIKLESQSAKTVIEILKKIFEPKSVIDIGCGAGIYLKEFKKLGIDILGYDGSPFCKEESSLKEEIKIHDLCAPLQLDRVFDLCICIEVAEHLEKQYSETLLDTLTGLSSNIVFTAATPGQGSKRIGHINEQPHEFWINLFKKRGFILQEKLTEETKKKMENKNVIWWITKNLMIFKKHE